MRGGHKGSLLLLLCSDKCPHNRPSGHGYLLATDCKGHPVGRLWISKQRLEAKCQNLITMDNRKNLMQRFMSDLGELFDLVCRIATHHFVFVCIAICLLRCYVYIFFCVNWNYCGLDLPTPGYQQIRFLMSYSDP